MRLCRRPKWLGRQVTSTESEAETVDRECVCLWASADVWRSLFLIRLSKLFVAHLLGSKRKQGSIPIISFFRAYFIILSEDQLSGDFLSSCVSKTSDAWQNVKDFQKTDDARLITKDYQEDKNIFSLSNLQNTYGSYGDQDEGGRRRWRTPNLP